MKIEIDCHGPASRWCSAAHVSLQLPQGASVADALDRLAARYPDFAARRASIAVALDDSVIDVSAALAEGSRLALIPPVSGG